MSINTEIVPVEEDWSDSINHERWIATKAAEHGFPIAGFLSEIYEDAVILFGPYFKSDWIEKKVNIGRVLKIVDPGNINHDRPMSFVILMSDGTQTAFNYGASHRCFFALPENTQNVLVLN